ncbi:MAG: hypothetical protein IRZ16_09360 [Myxococcaceae bacterium]|nr:hypothetical protein [Myxococcaceae bacterium]
MSTLPSQDSTPQIRFTEKEIVDALPPGDREVFLKLDPAERRFLIESTPYDRAVYAAMAPAEQTRYAKLIPAQRREYLRLPPHLKVLSRELSFEELSTFVSASPQEREAILSKTPAAQAARQKSQDIAARAAIVGRDVALLLSPFRDAMPDIAERATGMANNLLRSGKDEGQTRAEILKVLLVAKEILIPLSKEIAERVEEDVFRRGQPFLPSLIQQVVRPDSSLEQIVPEVIDQLTEVSAATAKRLAELADDDDDEDDGLSLKSKFRGGISG